MSVFKMDPQIRKMVSSCILCGNARCSKACQKLDVARFIRALYFDNPDRAAAMLEGGVPRELIAEAEKVCPMNVEIGKIVDFIEKNKDSLEGVAGADGIDLSCDICGVKLENPFLLSSSVVASNYEMCARAFEMGWAGACYKTICLMDIHEASPRFSAVKTPYGKWYGFKNIEQLSDHSLAENMDFFRRLKDKYPSKVIVASIMGRNEEEWAYLAEKVEEAGADVIECNFSCPNMEAKGTGSDVGQDPETVKRYTEATKRATKLPVLAKMTPNITDIRVPARASLEGGADGIAAINTIKSITGVNIDTMVAMPAVHGHSMAGGYSGAAVKPIALRMIAELAGMRKDEKRFENFHLSGMGGIETWRDAVEFLALGSGSLQITTAVMEFGYRIIDDLVDGLKIFMAQRGYRSLSQFIGGAVGSIVENDAIERDTVVYPIFDKDRCIYCGRCYLSCRDGGHQAIIMHDDKGYVSMDGKKCVGCQLCSLVCPVGAIKQSKRIAKKKD